MVTLLLTRRKILIFSPLFTQQGMMHFNSLKILLQNLGLIKNLSFNILILIDKGFSQFGKNHQRFVTLTIFHQQLYDH